LINGEARDLSKHRPGEPMTLGNMRELGVQRLVAYCLNDACRHVALIDVSKYPADTEVPWFRSSCAPSAAAAATRSTCGQIGKSNRRSQPDRQGVALIKRAKTQGEPAGQLQTKSRGRVASEIVFRRGRLLELHPANSPRI
jgi:hypothetical protein